MFVSINLAILIGAALIAASAFTSVLARRLGAPLLLLFLCIGLLAGEDGLLGIDFDDDYAAYFIGSLALAIILFDSGFDTPLESFRIAAARHWCWRQWACCSRPGWWVAPRTCFSISAGSRA